MLRPREAYRILRERKIISLRLHFVVGWYDHPPPFNLTHVFLQAKIPKFSRSKILITLFTLSVKNEGSLCERSNDSVVITIRCRVSKVSTVHSDDGTNCPREKLPPRYKLMVTFSSIINPTPWNLITLHLFKWFNCKNVKYKLPIKSHVSGSSW